MSTISDIDLQYFTYGGRHATQSEIDVWTGALANGATLATIRNAILNDPLGKTYIDSQINQSYQNYGGRAATSNELTVWEGALRSNGYDFGIVRNAILNDPLGNFFYDRQITVAYQTYGGRAPTNAELSVWEGALRSNGDNVGVIRDAILHDPLGRYYVDLQITAAYQTYGGRAPTAGELTVWEGALGTSGNYGMVRDAILHDPLGNYYYDRQITASYQTFGGRAPTSGELTVWEGALRGNGDNVAVIRDAILNDPLGRTYVDSQISSAYQTYGGRAPTAGEITVWEGALNGNNHNFSIVRDAILNDPLGKNYVDAQITAMYQVYGGRAPTAGEVQVWEAALNSNNHNFTVVRSAILNDPLGINNSTVQIDALYQRYFQRAASTDEQNVWHSIIRNGADFDALRDALMSDAGSAATTTQLSATSSSVQSKPYVVITGFDPAHDTINLQGAGYSNINPLDAAHAREIHQVDGTTDVFIALDASHEILIHNVALSQLSSADFLL